MITPIFRLDQDDDYIYVILTIPNCQLKEAEIFYESNLFLFYAHPYYLRLTLPGQLCSSEESDLNPETASLQTQEQLAASQRKEATFDCQTHQLTVPVCKKTPGQHFAGLDMITTFLAQPKTITNRKLVELIDSNEDAQTDLTQEELESFDWNYEQHLPVSLQNSASASLLNTEPYGFANSHSGVLERLGEEFEEILDICKPGHKSREERRRERLAKEEEDFDEEHYLADLYEQEDRIESMLKSVAPWETWTRIEKDILTDKDRQRMIDHVPRRDFVPFDKQEKKVIILSLIDILYAYCYDMRTNDYEHTVESGWTIRKVCPTLSWCETWVPIKLDDSELADLDYCDDMPYYALLGAMRRALIYPLYRNWDLAVKVARDVCTIMGKGRNALLKCLLDVHKVLNEAGDNHYVLNDLYLADYCEWVSKCCTSNQFIGLSTHLALFLDSGQLCKANVKLDLDLVERAAQLALDKDRDCNDNEDVDRIAHGIKKCVLIDQVQCDSDDD